MKTNALTLLAVSTMLLFTSCAVDRITKKATGEFSYTSARVGTDTNKRTVASTTDGIVATVEGENNSAAFQETGRVARFWLGIVGLKATVSGATAAYSAAQVTARHAATQTTTQLAAQEATKQAAIAAELAAKEAALAVPQAVAQ
jgi:hypothetical protein